MALPGSYQNRKTIMEIQYGAFISRFGLSYRVAASVLKFFKAVAIKEWRKIPDDFENDDGWRSTRFDEL